MSWAILVGSGVLECVWAAALDKSAGFSRTVPTIVFFVAMALSMLGLSHAVRDIPLGVAYSVWVGIGATLTLPTPPSSAGRVPRRCRLPLSAGWLPA